MQDQSKNAQELIEDVEKAIEQLNIDELTKN
jgi:hypothetical protein